jgi:hypothetical protein
MSAKTDDLKRRASVSLMLTNAERQEAKRAAERAGLPLSQFLRLITMSAIRSGQSINVGRARAS